MAKKKLAQMVLLAGLALAVLALVADPLGLGGYPGFGWKQTLLLVVGVGAAAAGAFGARKS